MLILDIMRFKKFLFCCNERGGEERGEAGGCMQGGRRQQEADVRNRPGERGLFYNHLRN